MAAAAVIINYKQQHGGGGGGGGGLRLFIWLLALALFVIMMVETTTMKGFALYNGSGSGKSLDEDDGEDAARLLLLQEDHHDGQVFLQQQNSRPGISRSRLIYELERLEARLNASKQEQTRLSEQLEKAQEEETAARENATFTTQQLTKTQNELAELQEKAKFDPWMDRMKLDLKINELKRLEILLANQTQANAAPLPDGFILRDKTLHPYLDRTVHRLWFDPDLTEKNKPKVQLLLTSFGWNQRDQDEALKYPRSKRELRIIKGLINHPLFHPTAWDLINKNATEPDPEVRYYVFPDWITCPDGNWPTYGGSGDENYDTSMGREYGIKNRVDIWNIVENNKLFQTPGVKATFMTFDCRGFGPTADTNQRRNSHGYPISIASLSAFIRHTNTSIDQGLPPPAGVQVKLTEEEEADIQSCRAESNASRPILLSFLGNFRGGREASPYYGPRGALADLNDHKEIFILRHFKDEFDRSPIGKWSYRDILARSRFSAAPRGDNKFSYRFTEVLSAGAIPVVMADDWQWPFRPELVDWNECAVILPENSARKTLQVLRNITLEQQCRMRQRCYEIYKTYIEDDRGVVNGLVEGLELVAQGHHAEPSGVRCLPEDDPIKECNHNRRRRRSLL